MTEHYKTITLLTALILLAQIGIITAGGLLINDKLSRIEKIVKGERPVIEHYKATQERIQELNGG